MTTAVSSDKKLFFDELVKVVGRDWASMDKEDILPYCRDEVSQALKVYTADYVVMPADVEEVQAVVRLANKYKVPIYPYSFGVSISSAAVPRNAGMMLVTRRMNQILEINEETMTATIEPGVTWSKLIYELNLKGYEVLPLGGGPHSGSLVGNFVLGGGNTGGIDMNEEVSIEVVLPTGELLRTASAGFIGHEKINPYVRVAWGPNLTGLFRGSLGWFGVVTKLLRRIYPLQKIQDRIEIAFDDFTDCVIGMREIVKLGICRQVYGLDQAQIAIIGATPELCTQPEEYWKFEQTLPKYMVIAKTNCHLEEQKDIYRKIILAKAAEYKGRLVTFTGTTKKALDIMEQGSSDMAVRYLRHNPHLMAFVQLPPSMLPGARKKTLEILDKMDFHMTSFHNKVVPPRIWLSPWERNESWLMEQDIEFDPLDKVSIDKFRKFMVVFFDEMANYGASQINAAFLRRYEDRMMPTYINMLKGIKKMLDPNGILAPRQVFKDI
ncbi:MAG: FAD-binding oxidoreductase [Chloroflexi bacterium]|nr:FAD-binding oxidoreductase [Chloroflexota bacterium]